MSEPAGDQASPIQVLAKAVRVMDCFTVSSPVLHVSEVRDRTGLPTATCARLLRSLVAEHLLERDGDHYGRACGSSRGRHRRQRGRR